MSAPGKVCMVTVRDVFANPWCEAPGVAVRKVPPRQVVENGQSRILPGYEETLCARHCDEHATDQ